jgi:hypothetical protein
VKGIEADPDRQHLDALLRSPVPATKQTPASKETGVRIELVAGAGFGTDSDNVPVVTARWLYAGVKQQTREMVRVGLGA